MNVILLIYLIISVNLNVTIVPVTLINLTMKTNQKKSNGLNCLSTKKSQNSFKVKSNPIAKFIISQSSVKSSSSDSTSSTSQSTSQSTSPSTQSIAQTNQRISKTQTAKLKLNLSNETNITNFYQQKKRLHLNNDSFDGVEDSPNKKHKMQKEENLPIGWDTPNTPNTNVDLNLNLQIAIDSTINSTINTTNQQQNDSNSNVNLKKPTNNRIDQMLDDFHAKLQFNSLTKTPDKDAGQMQSDLDGMQDDWTLSDSPEELQKIENMIYSSKQTKYNVSKESGISSCNSIDLKKQTISPLVVDNHSKLSSDRNQFKIPETPIKKLGKLGTSKLDTSVQFFSTPKVISRQQNKINQTLNFKGISPIKGSCNENSLINVKSENKRQLNDSVDQESLTNKKRNGKVLFVEKPKDEFEFEDDSFDVLCSQLDDKELLRNKKTTNTKLNSKPAIKSIQSRLQPFAQKNQMRARVADSSNRKQALFNGQTSTGSTMSSRSNSPSLSSLQCRQSMNTRSKTATKSSLQFTDDSSNIFAVDSQESPVNRQIKKPDDSMNDFLMNDEDDFICSQVVV